VEIFLVSISTSSIITVFLISLFLYHADEANECLFIPDYSIDQRCLKFITALRLVALALRGCGSEFPSKHGYVSVSSCVAPCV